MYIYNSYIHVATTVDQPWLSINQLGPCLVFAGSLVFAGGVMRDILL